MRVVEEKWERDSGSKCLFAIIEKQVAARNMRQQLIDKIADSNMRSPD